MFRELFVAGTTRRYWYATSLLMVVYVLGLLVAMAPPERIASLGLRVAAALATLPALLGFVYVEFLRIRRMDELRQRIELEAGTLAAAVSIPLLTVFGLLDQTGLLKVPLLLAAPFVCAVYFCAQIWAHRHYR